MSIDTFKDTLIINNFVEKNAIRTAEDLFGLIESLNARYQREGVKKMCDLIAKQNQAQRTIVTNCFAKCETSPPKYMFLGLFKGGDWIDDLTS
jgi:hypothetical protein